MPRALGEEFLTTRELAELLHIKERRVYELAASGEVPCSRATGKLLFPRDAIHAWIARSSSGPSAGAGRTTASVFAGSYDPLLEWALRESRAGFPTYLDGSLDGVERFAAGEAVAVGMHVYDPAADAWNVPLVERRFAASPVVLAEFAWRERGFVVAPGREQDYASITSLRGARVVTRQAEAGTQKLLDHLLEKAAIDTEAFEHAGVARTETDAALAVLEGKADVALGLLGVARQLRLGFVPLVRERFDLLVHRRLWFEPPMQRLLAFCTGEAFQRKAAELGGYDVGGLGRVWFNGP